MAENKGSKTNPTRVKGSEAVAGMLTERTCDHCGERIAVNKVVTIRRVTIGERGRTNSKMLHFAAGHPTEVQAA